MPYRDWANLGIQLKADYELFNSVSGNMVLMQGRIFAVSYTHLTLPTKRIV